MTDDYNSDAEREIAMANRAHLDHLRGFIAQVFALPDVEQTICDIYAAQIADAIEVLGERGKL